MEETRGQGMKDKGRRNLYAVQEFYILHPEDTPIEACALKVGISAACAKKHYKKLVELRAEREAKKEAAIRKEENGGKFERWCKEGTAFVPRKRETDYWRVYSDATQAERPLLKAGVSGIPLAKQAQLWEQALDDILDFNAGNREHKARKVTK